jgi:hypothetical protein
MSPNPLKSLLFAFAAIAIILVLTALQTVSFWVFDVAVLLAVVLVATLAFRSFSNLPPKPMLESTAAGLFAFCPAYLAPWRRRWPDTTHEPPVGLTRWEPRSAARSACS